MRTQKDSEKDDFHKTVEATMVSLPDQEYKLLCDDLNGHNVEWREEFDRQVGPLLGTQNLEGQRLLNFCQSQNLVVTKTLQ